MSPDAIGLGGEDRPHDTMQPHVSLNVCIALVGEFPSHG
jgi:microcystin-dependent protein